MNLFKKIFGSPSVSSEKNSKKEEVMVNISSVIKNRLPANSEVIEESQIPNYCSIGNLIFEKKYNEAIELGNRLLKETPYSAGVHVNLMDAYFKIRDENTDFYDKYIEHARLSMLYGHNTGYVQKKLVIGLEKQGRINNAIQVCNIVLMDKFHFSSHGGGKKEEFINRKEKLIKKLNKSLDNNESMLFTEMEISSLIELIRMEDKRINQEKIDFNKRMVEYDKKIKRLLS